MFYRNPLVYLFLKGWQYAGRYKLAIVAYLLMFFCAECITLCDPWVIGKLLNVVQTQAPKVRLGHDAVELLRSIITYLTIFLGLKIAFWIFHGPGRVIERIVSFQIKANYKNHLFGLVTQMPMQWHRDHHSGESIDKINRASNALADFYSESFQVCYTLFAFVGVEIILFRFMPFAGFISLVTTMVAFGAIFFIDNVLCEQYDSLNKFENHVASAVHDYITNVISVVTLRLESRVLTEIKKRINVAFALFKSNVTANELKWGMTTILIAVMIVVVMSCYAYSAIAAGHKILGGTFFMLFEYLRRIGDSFYGFAGVYSSVVRKASDVRGAESLHAAALALKERRVLAPLPKTWQKIAVNNLHFTYKDEKHRTHHLENVQIDLVRGSLIALVGESGSGKSTLLSLLRGLQDPNVAEVECDGVRLPYGLRHLSLGTTLIPQDPEIFADTLKFNVTFGLEANLSEVMEALRMARFEMVLTRLPFGLETSLVEKGVNLSGGEKQRLALARGLYFAKDADIVLLDEPTSSVDTHNERLIYRRVRSALRDKCVISSIHKLHLLEMFDMVYVLKEGRIIEYGTFTTLLRKNGMLTQMWKNYQAAEAPTRAISDLALPRPLTPLKEIV